MAIRWADVFKDRRGATSVEYGVLVACVVLALIAAVAALGDALLLHFSRVDEAMPK